jgi:hypothetical protein
MNLGYTVFNGTYSDFLQGLEGCPVIVTICAYLTANRHAGSMYRSREWPALLGDQSPNRTSGNKTISNYYYFVLFISPPCELSVSACGVTGAQQARAGRHGPKRYLNPSDIILDITHSGIYIQK